MQKATKKLIKELSVEPIRKTDIIQVTYANTNADVAYQVLGTLADTYLNAHLALHRSPGAYKFFQEQSLRYETDLKEAENQLALFDQGHALAIGDQRASLLQYALETENAANEAQRVLLEQKFKLAETNVKLATIEPRIRTQSRTLPNQYSVERLNSLLVELQNRRTQLLSKFQPTDRLVTSLDEEIRNTTAALEHAGKLVATEESTDVNPIWGGLQADKLKADMALSGARSRYDSLKQQLDMYKSRLSVLETVSVERDALLRRVKETEQNYLLYTKKQEEARIADLLDVQKFANIALVEKPSRAYLPYKPEIALNLGLGFILAVFISLGGVFIYEQMEQPAMAEA